MVTHFKTDFSTTQKIRTSTSLDFSDFPDPHYVEYRVPDECLTFENLLGARALKVAWGDTLLVVGENPRPHVIIYNPPNEYWLEIKLCLSMDFNLKGSWCLIGQPLSSHYFSSSDVYPSDRITTPIFLEGKGDGTGSLGVRNEVNYHTAISASNQTKTALFKSTSFIGLVVRGETTNIRAHVLLHPTNGIYELWINAQKITDFRGKTLTGQATEIDPIDHYKRVDEIVSSIYWRSIRIDDYNFFDEIPLGPMIEPPPPGSFTIEVKPCIATAAGAPLALLTGLRAIRTYLPKWFVKRYYSFSRFVLVGW